MSKLQETLATVLEVHQPHWPAPVEHPGYVTCICLEWADSCETEMEAERSHRYHIAERQAASMTEAIYSDITYVAECGHFVTLDMKELENGGWEVLLLEANK